MTALLVTVVLALGPAQPVQLTPDETLNVHDAGDGSPVVLLPGLSGCAYGYRKIVGPLQEAGFRTVVIEPLGYGASSRPRKADYSLTAQADRVAEVMDRLGIKAAIVVAHGASGSTAMRMAYRRPDLVAAIVSVEGGPQERAGNPALERSLGWAGLIVKVGGGRLLRERYGEDLREASGDASWVDRKTLGRYLRNIDRDLGAAVGALRAMARADEPESLRDNLARINCPVLLLMGAARHSSSVPADDVALLAARLPRFSSRAVPGAGHFIFEERPDAVIRAVRDISNLRHEPGGSS